MKIIKRLVAIALCLLLIPVAAVLTAAAKQRFADGPKRLFSGGPLVAGELHKGPEPDWSFVDEIETIELQLVDPPRSRRIWIATYEGKPYLLSSFMRSTVGRLWKRWPVQAERNGRAVIRIDGKRYERELIRIKSGDALDGITAAIRMKYGHQVTRASVEAGDDWVFEAAPRD